MSRLSLRLEEDREVCKYDLSHAEHVSGIVIPLHGPFADRYSGYVMKNLGDDQGFSPWASIVTTMSSRTTGAIGKIHCAAYWVEDDASASR